MGIGQWLKQIITIYRFIDAGTVDHYGRPDGSWESQGTILGWIQPRTARELGGDLEASMGAYKMYAKYGADISIRDQVVEGGNRYEVLDVKNAAGMAHHYEVDLRKIK